ncbi:EAL domain-containing protein [Pseudokineococcus sp. 1T1Z-3]|uniref:EAL domain-containing protein n=1 Tax=Pseudokineococcus sp. 1T1Z-3 TaxID=3132745 RepID=UPI0030AC9542
MTAAVSLPAEALPHEAPTPWRGVPAAAAVTSVLADPDLLGCAVQPLVDLEKAVVAGYEVLARPHERLATGPHELFAAATDPDALGALHVLALRGARRLRPDLPPDTFLSVNVDPRALADPEVLEELESWGDLGGVVVEVLEGAWPEDSRAVFEGLAAVRDAGGTVALDDVGAGWSGLSRMLEVRPSVVKVDRGLVARLGTDPAAEATVRAVGELAGTLDAWVCLEGVETSEQLRAARRLCVPLVQGFLLGRPAPAWPTPDLGVVRELASPLRRRGLGPLVVDAEPGGLELDGHDRPVAVRALQPDSTPWWHPVTTLSPDTDPRRALARAMARPAADRFAPLVVTAAHGRALGVVHVEVLATAVATAQR